VKTDSRPLFGEPPVASAAPFEAFWERSPLIAWIEGEDGRCVYVNAAWRDGLGDATAWPGKPCRPDGSEGAGRGYLNALSSAVETIAGSGPTRHFLVTRFSLDGSGGQTRIGAVAMDVTGYERHMEEMERLSVTDDLTGLYNRRGFLRFAEHELKIARRRKSRCALMYFDIDHLKRVNDNGGHGAGDRLLKEAAAMLRREFRETDVIGRLGGDEFAVLAPDVAGSEDSLRRRLRGQLSTLTPERGAGPLSLSVGVVACEWNDDTDLTAMLATADRQLYDEKHHKARQGLPPNPLEDTLRAFSQPGRAPPA